MEYLFPELKTESQSITERIKTFEDAMEALGQGNTLVEEYIAVRDKLHTDKGDLIAYLKLRIITAALNEGWKPQFTTDKHRYYPWFRSGGNTNASSGFVHCYAGRGASYSHTSNGSQLAFKTRELAAYAGRQFTDEWIDFLFKPRTK